VTIHQRLQMLRDSVNVHRANAAEERDGRRQLRSPRRQPSRWLLWSLLLVTGAAMFLNLLGAFNGSIFAAVLAGWTALIIVRLWRALGAVGALGGDR
jgi:hypothetical protein